jgi:septum formation protein
MQTLILASSSPRRKALLQNLNLSFEVLSKNVDECFSPDLQPSDIVMELAQRKAQAVFKERPEAFVIGSDTIVVFQGQILHKPADEADAVRKLRMLSGNRHEVYTGVSILSPHGNACFFEKTEVLFWELTDDEILSYVQSGEPLDKAGAYGIQGYGSMLVKKIDGDYYAVVGLPVSRTIRELKKLGYKMPYEQ